MSKWLYHVVSFLGGFLAWIPVGYFVWREQKHGTKVPEVFDTPDDSVSPRGMYEPTVKKINSKLGTFWSDWYWLGWRNKLYGFAYAHKPFFFKQLTSYDPLVVSQWFEGSKRITEINNYRETIYKVGPIGIITGYRLGPIFGKVRHELGAVVKHPNMDARPVLSFRPYKRCVNDGGIDPKG